MGTVENQKYLEEQTWNGIDKKWNIVGVGVVCLVVMFNQTHLRASSIGKASERVTDGLEGQQIAGLKV